MLQYAKYKYRYRYLWAIWQHTSLSFFLSSLMPWSQSWHLAMMMLKSRGLNVQSVSFLQRTSHSEAPATCCARQAQEDEGWGAAI